MTPVVADVVGRDRIVQRGGIGGGCGVDHSGQGFIVDHDGFGGVFGLHNRFGDDERHLITHM